MTETPTKNDKPFTHTAWILKTDIIRKGRRLGRWINEGDARYNSDDGTADIYLHSLPIGGFAGHIHLAKIGTSPPDLTPTPQRPDAASDGEQDSEE